MSALKILFVAAEMAPLVKMGGLGDVVGALPRALTQRGHDVRVLLPACDPALLRSAQPLVTLAGRRGQLLERRGDDLPCPVWLLRTPGWLRRRGSLYRNRAGNPWADDALQFGRFGRVAADIAGGLLPQWRPDVLHCHDWHTGLAPLWMVLDNAPAASVFTIHNLAYQGCFAPDVLPLLGLPEYLNHPEAMEFHGRIAFIKGGLRYADRLTTVSPGHAREILTPESGCGLDGLLRARAGDLQGILNGIDPMTWDPATDPLLPYHFDAEDLSGKRRARRHLHTLAGFSPRTHGATELPVLAWVGRLVHQKGADLLPELIPQLLQRPLHLVILGSGDRPLESALRVAARRWRGRMWLHLGFDEALAHQAYAGSDFLLMPSRHEPCGLAQLCAMRYGCIPLVTPVGGLADTVRDADSAPGEGTGFYIARTEPGAVLDTLDRALALQRDPGAWQALVNRAMNRRVDWDRSAAAYESVYREAIAARAVVRELRGSAVAALPG